MTTVADVLNAIQKNGLKKIKKSYLRDENNHDYGDNPGYLISEIKWTGGCAIGQAGLNLNLNPSYLRTCLDRIIVEDDESNRNYLGDWIIDKNDHTDMSLKEIAQLARKKFRKHLKEEI